MLQLNGRWVGSHCNLIPTAARADIAPDHPRLELVRRRILAAEHGARFANSHQLGLGARFKSPKSDC